MGENSSRAYSSDDLRLVLLRAWQRAGVSPKCELCQHPRWNIIQKEELDGLGYPLRSGDKYEVPGNLYMVYALECRNCGNVRTFSRPTIERLAAEHEEAAIEAAVKALPAEGSEDAGSE